MGFSIDLVGRFVGRNGVELTGLVYGRLWWTEFRGMRIGRLFR
jgi:hypothetical protein